MVVSVTRTLSYTFGMMIILPIKQPLLQVLLTVQFIMVIHRNFTFEIHYTIMLKAFNDLSAAGYAHSLNNTNKINTFEQCLTEIKAIH